MASTSLKKLQRFFYWVLPIAILSFIYTKIDIPRLINELKHVDVWIYVLAVMYFPLVMLIGATRWKVLSKQHLQETEKLSYLVRHYWIGMSIGFFMPGSIGWDIYRIMLLGKKYGNYAANIVIILLEKFLALFVCMGMILFIYPFIDTYGISSDIKSIIDIAFYLFIFCLFLLISTILIKKVVLFQSIITSIEEKLKQVFFSILNKVKKKPQQNIDMSWNKLLGPITNPKNLILPILLTILNIVVTGVGTHLFFEALNYDISLLINIFVAPVFFFIFILPISFGSIGIREGAFVFIYGLFGVPAEIALIVSFFGLSGILINNVIGGLLIYKKKGSYLPTN
jgi:uncharacterized protein (TIRG00374 family)